MNVREIKKKDFPNFVPFPIEEFRNVLLTRYLCLCFYFVFISIYNNSTVNIGKKL